MVLGVRPQLLSVMVPRLIKPPVTSTNLRALGALAEVAGGRPAWPHARRFALFGIVCKWVLCLWIDSTLGRNST